MATTRIGTTGADDGATWWVEVSLEESAGAVHAEARLRTRLPTPLRARGTARLDHPDAGPAAREDAVARALAALAERLAALATDDLETRAHASASVVVLEAEAPAPCPRTPDDAPAYGRYPS
jgi:hypothetical protein